jgi:hypothetical protein
VRLSATFSGGSDGASNALQAWDLLHGNWLLRGWTLTDVSFYTTELPEYAAVELARGLNPGVLHVAAALTYTLLVLLAGFLARGRARGAEGWARALIAAGVMVAPQLGDGVHVLLAQPDHVGTGRARCPGCTSRRRPGTTRGPSTRTSWSAAPPTGPPT